MNIRHMASSALTACVAQGVSFLVSLFMSFVVPKLLGADSYGYWQLFVFYAGYSGFFLFGLNDGIYLIEGGRTRDEIDRRKIASQFWLGVTIQLIVAVVIGLFAYQSAAQPDRAFVLLSFAVYTVIFNASGLLGYLFQAMNETKRFSYMTMLERGVFLVPLFLFILFNQTDYRILVLSYIFSRTVAFLYAIWLARDILFSGILPFVQAVAVCARSIKAGFSLMVANIADLFTMGVSRVLVDHAWGIAVFGQVSFSLSIINFFITFVTQASMVFFPVLRQGNLAERRKFYQGIREATDLVFPAAYLLYWPLALILGSWLPEYRSSLYYFALLMPMCVYNAKMYALCQTYFKVLRRERVLLAITCIATIASAVLSLFGIYVASSLEVVLIGVVAVIACREICSEFYLADVLNVSRSNLSVFGVGLSLLFIVLTSIMPPFLAFLIYGIAYALYLVINRSVVRDLIGLALRAFAR